MCVFRIPGPGGAVRDNDRDEVIDRPTVSVCMCASQSRHGGSGLGLTRICADRLRIRAV